jgi:hypothetical protein
LILVLRLTEQNPRLYFGYFPHPSDEEVEMT